MTPPAPPFRLIAARLDAAALRRAVLAGTAWGLAVAAGMTALDTWRCGFVCLDAAAWTLLLATAPGIVTIGPLAAFGGGRKNPTKFL